MPSSEATATPGSESRTEQKALRRFGLRYVSDAMPGIRRRRRGRSFSYYDPEGRRIVDEATVRRINSLVIPPAYRDVWICPLANGHLQATGRDDAGRKQYRYHPRYVELRSQNKFEHLAAFARALPRLRRIIDEDLRRPCFDRRRMTAAAVRLLDVGLIRVGNREYASRNNSYGVTTLRRRHVEVHGSRIELRFTGKHGIETEATLTDPRLARLIRRCRELPGYELFAYRNGDGARHVIGSGDVNEYLAAICGADFTAKYFRTWGGSVLAAITLGGREPPQSEREADKAVVETIKSVAAQLGNRAATCRKYYIHPEVIRSYRSGRLHEFMNAHPRADRPVPWRGLSAEEKAVLKLLDEANAD